MGCPRHSPIDVPLLCGRRNGPSLELLPLCAEPCRGAAANSLCVGLRGGSGTCLLGEWTSEERPDMGAGAGPFALPHRGQCPCSCDRAVLARPAAPPGGLTGAIGDRADP